ncbi:MAG: hypothetical protein ACKVY0_07295 [Prosthecobacter sp.]|uniref:hypothetical protein n=1 Tax=Prosthecobacter sp. TaxID=1965333 RepID=UPI0039029383
MTESHTACQTCGAAMDTTRSEGVCAICLFGDALEKTAGESFGGHELIEELARGGMGVVYRARRLKPGREVALKTLRGASLDSPDALERFRNEAAAMAGLEHPAILPVFQFGESDGVPFCTLKLMLLRDAGVLEIWDLSTLAAEFTALGMLWHLPPPLSPAPPGITGPVQETTLRPLYPRAVP